ncbi:MAG: LysR family transcriptional regulator [Gammaproteobacteria bacterium]|nr:MAG: LysR family transcriptional regulator [Gammaproteobacteria bacterium]
MADRNSPPDLNLLRVFDAIMGEGSLTRAAERLDRSQPAISLALGKLRRLTGDPLFEPHGRGMRPTRRALEMREGVRRVLEQSEQLLVSQPRFDPATSDREFHLVLHEYADLLVLPRLVTMLASLGSSIRLRLHPWTADTPEALRTGEVDLCFDAMPSSEPRVTCELVVREPYVVILRADHPAATAPMTLQRYLALEHVSLAWPAGHQPFIDNWLMSHGHRRRVRMRVFSLSVLKALVSSSDLICALPRGLAGQFTDHTAYVVQPAPFLEVEFCGYLKWRDSMRAEAGHRWLIGTFREVLAATRAAARMPASA